MQVLMLELNVGSVFVSPSFFTHPNRHLNKCNKCASNMVLVLVVLVTNKRDQNIFIFRQRSKFMIKLWFFDDCTIKSRTHYIAQVPYWRQWVTAQNFCYELLLFGEKNNVSVFEWPTNTFIEILFLNKRYFQKTKQNQ